MLEKGQIVYWVGTNVYNCQWPHYFVRWGLVETEYPYVVFIKLYEKVDTRMINGIKLSNYQVESRYRKLPKGWSYDTKLFDLTDEPMPEEFRNLRVNSEEDIKYAIAQGWLVPVEDNPHWTPYVEIDKNSGWRITKQYDDKVHANTIIDKNQIFFTYDDALAEVNRLIAEIERQANLNDEEWSKEEIEKCIGIWAKQNGLEPDCLRVQKVRDFLTNLENIADVEVRTSTGLIQYRYWKNKRWINVEK